MFGRFRCKKSGQFTKRVEIFTIRANMKMLLTIRASLVCSIAIYGAITRENGAGIVGVHI